MRKTRNHYQSEKDPDMQTHSRIHFSEKTVQDQERQDHRQIIAVVVQCGSKTAQKDEREKPSEQGSMEIIQLMARDYKRIREL